MLQGYTDRFLSRSRRVDLLRLEGGGHTIILPARTGRGGGKRQSGADRRSMSKKRLYPGTSCRYCQTWVPEAEMVCLRCLAVKVPVAFEAKGMFLSGCALTAIAGTAMRVMQTLSGIGSFLAGIATAVFTIAAIGFLWFSAKRFIAWSRSGRVDFRRWAPETD
jgi:hypothetical protein